MRFSWMCMLLFTFARQGMTQFTIANGLPGCLPVVNQMGIACGGGTTFFGVNGSNQFQVQNIDGIMCCAGPGGDSQSYFEFDILNISDYMNISISMNYSASNTTYEDDSPLAPIFGCQGTIVDNSHDQMVFTYSIDGGPEIQSLYVHGTTQAAFTGTWNVSGLSGNTLKIRIYASNKANAEIFYFQNLLIQGTPKLTAGPDDVICYPGPADLNGFWNGTWSGGTGTIANNTIPVTTYTPSPGEQGTSVTLTYTGFPAYPGCPVYSDQMVVTIDPEAVVDQPADITACSGEFISVLFTGTGTGYSWVNSNPAIGLNASGTGDIGFNAANVLTTQTGTITVTPLGPCPGTPKTFTIVINPAPDLNQPPDVVVCAGDPVSVIFSGTGTSYSWTNSNIAIGLGASGNGDIIYTAPNVGTSQTGTITVTPNGLCPGLTKSFTITVNPLIVPALNPLGPYCTSQSNVSLPTIQNGISGNWSGPGVVGNQLQPSTLAPGMYTLTFTPLPGQCAAPNTIQFEIIQSPTGNLSGSPVLCPGECGTVMFSFSGGSGTYSLNMNMAAGFINFNFPMIGVTNNTVLTLCLGGGIFFDQATNTLTVPNFIPPGTYTLSLINFNSTPAGPCSNGIVGSPGSISVTIAAEPPASSSSMTLCDTDQNGTEVFNLTSQNNIVNNNMPANTVAWFTDMTATNPILNPANYISGNATVYAQITGATGCTKIVPVTLTLDAPVDLMLQDFSICINGPVVDLPVVINGISGLWSGTNVISSGTQFDPTGLPTGTYPITFLPNSNQCALPSTVNVNITSAGPVPLTTPISTVCEGAALVTLANTQGGIAGVWSGSPFLSGNVFNTTASGTGTFTLTFTPTGPLTCYSPNTTQIVVTANTVLTPVVFNDICMNSAIINLGNTVGGFTGTWTGNVQIVNNTFNPNAPAGIYPMIFITDDFCAEGFSTEIEIISPQILTPPALGPACVNSNPINLPATIDGFSGTWSYNAIALTVFNPATFGSGTFDLLFTPNAGQCAGTFISTITVTTYTAGNDNNQQLCKSDAQITDLNNYLSAGTTPGGIWALNNTPLSDPQNFDLNILPQGTSTFTYILDDAQCGKDTAFVIFSVSNPNNAGNNTQLTLCEINNAPVNFNSALGGFDPGGTWIQPAGVNLDFSDPSSVSIAALNPGTFDFQYIVPADNCVADSAHAIIELVPFNDAGTDDQSTLCLGSTIDLISLINTPYTGGVILNPSSVPGLSGSTWNTAGTPAGQYLFQYQVVNAPGCPADTAQLHINLAAIVQAGNDNSALYCEGNALILESFLPPNASAGGTFYLNGTEIVGGIYNNPGISPLQFIYVTGDGQSCPKDTSVINLNPVEIPDVNMSGLNDVCEKSCTNLTLAHNLPLNAIIYFSMKSGAGINYTLKENITNSNDIVIQICPSPTGPFSFSSPQIGRSFTVHVDSIHLQSGNCTFVFPQTLQFSTLQLPARTISKTLCQGQTLLVGNDTYNETKPSGTTIIASTDPLKCDSIITVNLQFKAPSPATDITLSTCDQNYAVKVGNTTFNKTNPNGSVLLKNSSGCDSLIRVNLSFNTFSTGNFDRTTCDPNATFMIGTEVFNAARKEGTVTLQNAGASGCDSIVQVKIVYLQPAQFQLKQQTCDDTYSVTIGGIVFNKSKPTGVATLTGMAKNGCDSIVNVQITFLLKSAASYTYTTCNSDFTFSAGNKIFNKSNPAGQVLFPGSASNGCDSILNVQIVYTDFIVSNTLTYKCDDNNAEIMLNNASHPGPYEISVDGQMVSGTQILPFSRLLNPGPHAFTIRTTNGCKDSISLNVEDNSNLIVDLTQTLNSDGTVQINVIAPQNFIYDLNWTPSGSLSCSDCVDPIANPSSTTTYTLQYLYGNDCPGQRTIIIERVNTDVVFPNIISPNNDGSNDVFFVVFPDKVNGIVKSMKIYDRWGNLVFSATDTPPNTPAVGWDGNFNGKMVNPGVFAFLVTLQLEGKAELQVYSGDLTVIR